MRPLFFYASLLLLSLLFLGVVGHQIWINRQLKHFKAPGTWVQVNGCAVHVYQEGKSGPTLVFLPGSGVPSPYLNFKNLTTLLSSKYRVVVIEKPGYGFSEASHAPRDVRTLTEEDRLVLQHLKIGPPYVLVPFSISTLEALNWVHSYPQEVTAIIGLDPGIPGVYRHLRLNISSLQLWAFFVISKLGLSHLLPIPKEAMTGVAVEDQSLARAMFYKNFFNISWLNEAKHVRKNAEIVGQHPIPVNTPMLFAISDGAWAQALGVNHWRDILHAYLAQLKRGEALDLPCGHDVHNCQPKMIAKSIEQFLDLLNCR